MVPRSELLTALGDVKGAREEARARAGEVSALEEQLGRVREQLSSTQSAMTALVPESELHAARARIEEGEAQMRASGERQRGTVEGLKEQALGLQRELDDLHAAVKVRLPGCLPQLWVGGSRSWPSRMGACSRRRSCGAHP